MRFRGGFFALLLLDWNVLKGGSVPVGWTFVCFLTRKFDDGRYFDLKLLGNIYIYIKSDSCLNLIQLLLFSFLNTHRSQIRIKAFLIRYQALLTTANDPSSPINLSSSLSLFFPYLYDAISYSPKERNAKKQGWRRGHWKLTSQI